jgi:hypothetical protein
MSYERYSPDSRSFAQQQNPLEREARYIAQQMDGGNAELAGQRLRDDLMQLQRSPQQAKQLVELVQEFDRKGNGADLDIRLGRQNGFLVATASIVDYDYRRDDRTGRVQRQAYGSDSICRILLDQNGGRDNFQNGHQLYRGSFDPRQQYRGSFDPRQGSFDPRRGSFNPDFDSDGRLYNPNSNRFDQNNFDTRRYWENNGRFNRSQPQPYYSQDFDNRRFSQNDPRFYNPNYSQNDSDYYDPRTDRRNFAQNDPRFYDPNYVQDDPEYLDPRLRPNRRAYPQNNPRLYDPQAVFQNDQAGYTGYTPDWQYNQDPSAYMPRMRPNYDYSQNQDYPQNYYQPGHRQSRSQAQNHNHNHSHDHGQRSNYSPRATASTGDAHGMDADAAEALNRAEQMAARNGVKIQVSSGFRTHAEQARLYAELHGKSPVAKPGTSSHESGLAIDVKNFQQAKPYLVAAGFVHGDGRGQIAGDPWHFRYMG